MLSANRSAIRSHIQVFHPVPSPLGVLAGIRERLPIPDRKAFANE
jgi:hypothetical protein